MRTEPGYSKHVKTFSVGQLYKGACIYSLVIAECPERNKIHAPFPENRAAESRLFRVRVKTDWRL